MSQRIQRLTSDLDRFVEENGSVDVNWSIYTNRTGKQLLSRFDSYVPALRACGVKSIALMTDSQLDDDSRKPTYSLSKYDNNPDLLFDVCYKIQSLGFETTLVSWVDIDQSEIDKFFDGFSTSKRRIPGFGSLVVDSNSSGGEIDWEGANDPSDSVVKYFSDRLAEDKQKFGYDLDVDTHAARVSTREPLHLFGQARTLAVQMYCSYDPEDPDRFWGAPHGPGARQRYADKRIKEYARAFPQYPFESYAAILACWNQEYPANAGGGSTGVETMLACASQAITLGYTDLRLWKLKNFIENEYAQIALQTINSIVSRSK